MAVGIAGYWVGCVHGSNQVASAEDGWVVVAKAFVENLA